MNNLNRSLQATHVDELFCCYDNFFALRLFNILDIGYPLTGELIFNTTDHIIQEYYRHQNLTPHLADSLSLEKFAPYIWKKKLNVYFKDSFLIPISKEKGGEYIFYCYNNRLEFEAGFSVFPGETLSPAIQLATLELCYASIN